MALALGYELMIYCTDGVQHFCLFWIFMVFADSKVEIFFRPVVNPLDGQVLIYRAVPVETMGDKTRVGAKQVLEHRGDPMDTAHRNGFVLHLCGLALAAAHNRGRSVMLMLPVNAAAMETKESTTEMVKAFKALAPVCAKAAISHIFNLPDRVNADSLADIIIPTLISVDKFIVEPPATITDYTVINACNAQGVVLDMQPGEGEKIDLTKFWARAAPRRLGMFVQNAADEDLIAQLERYEGRGIDGSVFGDVLREIGPRTNRSALHELAQS